MWIVNIVAVTPSTCDMYYNNMAVISIKWLLLDSNFILSFVYTALKPLNPLTFIKILIKLNLKEVLLVEIWDNKVPKHQFGYPSAWQAMILLVENSDRIASGQLDHYTPNPSDTHVR